MKQGWTLRLEQILFCSKPGITEYEISYRILHVKPQPGVPSTQLICSQTL
jgi:hypothetical protein